MSSLRIAVAAVTLAAAPAHAVPSASTAAPLLAGEPGVQTIVLRGVPGTGALGVDANVGSIERVEAAGDRVLVRYRAPAKPFPHRLCLLLWRQRERLDARFWAVRLPIFARTAIPVQTRRHSQVTIRVGDQHFGPLASGARGRLSARVLVPPEARHALVEVVDDAGLRSQKQIAIQTPSFNELAMALIPDAPDHRPPRFRVVVAAATPSASPPRLQVGADLLPLERGKEGIWSALWAPASRPPEGPLAIKVWLPGHSESLRYAQLQIAASTIRVEVLKVRPVSEPARGWPSRRGLGADLGLGVGMMHNLGALFAPRVSVDLCLDYPLPFGRIGVRVLASFARGSQQIPSERPALGEVESTVILLPFGGGVAYRMTSLPLSPFLFAGLLAQLVRSATGSEALPERLRHDWALAVLGLAGIEPRLGPGRVFLQAGYQWSQIENPDLVMLGGGIVVEGGYRLEL